MKLLNKKQKNNAGFSLVELIVVIAIMVVLVAVLAPLFTKYIESSRRSTDVQNANSIAEGVLADVADNATWYQSYTDGTRTKVVAGTPSAVKDTPTAKGDAVSKGGDFYFVYTKSDNNCKVFIDNDTTYNLAEEGVAGTSDSDPGSGAQGYKNK